MAKIRPANPVKLFVGLLGGDVGVLRRARQLLVRKFGSTDVESEIWPFTQTDYYTAEMGPGLQRWFLAFEPLIRPDQLADIKNATNRIEHELAEDCLAVEFPRVVNLDPGFLDLGKIVLASCKDHAHRIYLMQGIYAECTLFYRDGQWQKWPWTYPDFQTAHYHAYFDQVRQRLVEQRGQLNELLSRTETSPDQRTA